MDPELSTDPHQHLMPVPLTGDNLLDHPHRPLLQLGGVQPPPAWLRDLHGSRTSKNGSLQEIQGGSRSARLGEWIAELEVPDEVEADEGAVRKLGRHVDLYGATAAQLRGYVVQIHPLPTEPGRLE
jgi:hypothetical protein